MGEKTTKVLDEVDRKLLHELQSNARISYTELGQRVGLSSPAVTERVHKLEDAGVISGYHAAIDLDKVGLPVMAIVNIKAVGWQRTEAKIAQIEEISEVVELYRATGDDAVIVKVVAPSVDQLNNIVCSLANFGTPTTVVVSANSISDGGVATKLFGLGKI